LNEKVAHCGCVLLLTSSEWSGSPSSSSSQI
jgi:hypothetical protein